MKRRRTATLMMDPEAFTAKPFRVPATSGTAGQGGAFPQLSLLDRYEVPLSRPGVDLPRSRDLLIRVLYHLLPLREPAGDAGNGEHHREHLHRDLERLVDQTGVEVDVRVELPLDEVLVLERDLLQLERDVEQRVLAGHLEHVVRRLLDDPGARVVVLVNAVPEPHQPAFAGLHL